MSRKNEMKPFASDRLNELERDEERIRRTLGDNYYEHYHKQYQKETDFEGLMMCISLAIVLMMFCAYLN